MEGEGQKRGERPQVFVPDWIKSARGRNARPAPEPTREDGERWTIWVCDTCGDLAEDSPGDACEECELQGNDPLGTIEAIEVMPVSEHEAALDSLRAERDEAIKRGDEIAANRDLITWDDYKREKAQLEAEHREQLERVAEEVEELANYVARPSTGNERPGPITRAAFGGAERLARQTVESIRSLLSQGQTDG